MSSIREKAGRNEPCPCGSGRKYKHCCLANEPPSIDLLWQRQNEDSARFARELIRFADLRFGDQMHAAWQDFNLSDDPEPLEEAERQVFMPYFLYQWDPTASSRRAKAGGQGGLVARWFLLENSKRLGERERRFLEQATTQPMSFYEVLRVEPGAGMLVRDVLIGGETEVIERSASRSLRIGDLIYAQVWRAPQFSVLGCCAPYAGPPDKKVQIIELRKRLRKKIAKQQRHLRAEDLLRNADLIRSVYLDIRTAVRTPPRFCNTDGEPLERHTLHFRIESPDAALEALAPLSWGRCLEDLLNDAERDEGGKLLKVRLDWIRPGNRKFKSWDNTILGHLTITESRLIADVNSEKRAARLRKEIEKRLGACAVYENTVAETADQMLRAARRKAAGAACEGAEEPVPLDPEVMAQAQAAVQREVEAWIHKKIPALGGRTPLEAVRDPDGKEMVEALLLTWDRIWDREISPNQIRPDIKVVRALLNSVPPVSESL